MKHITLATLPACTSGPLTSAQLAPLVEGQTFTIQREGNPPYGETTFFPGNRVLWSGYDNTCLSGTWFEPEPGLICFDYPSDGEFCWEMQAQGGRITLTPSFSTGEIYTYTPVSNPQTCSPTN